MSRLSLTSDDTEVGRLRFSGDASGAAPRNVQTKAFALIVPSPAVLILDINDVTDVGSGFVELLNEVARRAIDVRRDVVVEVREDASGWLDTASLSSTIRIERTSRMVVAARVAARPARVSSTADGVARREGAGFVASYGSARRCAAAGCLTTLSRYNSDPLCWVHNARGVSARH